MMSARRPTSLVDLFLFPFVASVSLVVNPFLITRDTANTERARILSGFLLFV